MASSSRPSLTSIRISLGARVRYVFFGYLACHWQAFSTGTGLGDASVRGTLEGAVLELYLSAQRVRYAGLGRLINGLCWVRVFVRLSLASATQQLERCNQCVRSSRPPACVVVALDSWWFRSADSASVSQALLAVSRLASNASWRSYARITHSNTCALCMCQCRRQRLWAAKACVSDPQDSRNAPTVGRWNIDPAHCE